MVKKRYIIAGGVFILLIFLPIIYRAVYSSHPDIAARNGCASGNCSALKPEEEKNTQEESGLDQSAIELVPKTSEEEDEKVSIFKTDIAGMPPVESYLAIREEFFKIKSLDDLVLFSEIYGSRKNKISADSLKSVGGIIEDDFIISMIVSSVPSEISSTEIISLSDEECVIKVVSETKEEGEVKMVFEEGAWKLDYEEWRE
ncbi:MAG: hypothetical protein PHS16_00045 [Candidatus Colwellbacteria bacterium]|jgi:hypothetical protein|nr:hypothetical protein [Candidatus Colwellbacteria bacterium]MCK9497328.1 hypothetical protein [Candidatus Colwellbacteria bacterium]MDD3752330.1 hypothetical protein [Candidatus Colwellbacteria bacterium]MDD4818602.1 hypothetical protein [Candidatus Colwellbacteria bacterium]